MRIQRRGDTDDISDPLKFCNVMRTAGKAEFICREYVSPPPFTIGIASTDGGCKFYGPNIMSQAQGLPSNMTRVLGEVER